MNKMGIIYGTYNHNNLQLFVIRLYLYLHEPANCLISHVTIIDYKYFQFFNKKFHWQPKTITPNTFTTRHILDKNQTAHTYITSNYHK